MFTARYGLIPYIKQITLRLLSAALTELSGKFKLLKPSGFFSYHQV